MVVMDSGDRERETPSGRHYFFPFRNPCFISPQTRSCLSVSPGELRRISLLHKLSLLHYAISISSHLNPFSPACSLTLTISLVLHFISSSGESF